MSDTLTPERIAELREAIERGASGSAEYFALRVVARNLLKAAEERASLRAERDNLRQLLDDACEDESEIHRRLDAALPPDAMLTVEPLMGGRTPLCGDDGRVAQLVAEIARLKSECDGVFTDYKLAQEAYHRSEKGIATLEAENARLRDQLARVKRVLPPGELYESILNALHEEKTP